MSTEPQNNKTTIVVVSIVAGIVLVVVLACGGLTYLGVVFVRSMSQAMSSAMQAMTEIQGSMMTAQSFLEDVAANRVDEAYEQTSEGYQAKTSREKFQEMLDNHPGLKKASAMMTGTNPGSNTARLTYVMTTPDGGNTTCTLQMIKEEDAWKVDRFTIDEPAEGKGKPTAKQAARKFFEDIAADKLDVAYSRTSDDYRQKFSPEQFKALVGKHAGFKQLNKQNLTPINVGAEQASFTATLTGPNGSVKCTVQLVQEDEDWKVDRFTVP